MSKQKQKKSRKGKRNNGQVATLAPAVQPATNGNAPQEPYVQINGHKILLKKANAGILSAMQMKLGAIPGALAGDVAEEDYPELIKIAAALNEYCAGYGTKVVVPMDEVDKNLMKLLDVQGEHATRAHYVMYVLLEGEQGFYNDLMSAVASFSTR